jgi:hypothetical protein
MKLEQEMTPRELFAEWAASNDRCWPAYVGSGDRVYVLRLLEGAAVSRKDAEGLERATGIPSVDWLSAQGNTDDT